MLIEPVLGEGAMLSRQPAFSRGVRQVCDQHGILLIADEIQSGFGRTGRWFAREHFDLRPDIMTVAKGMASGLPLSGVFSRLELMKKWKPGSHGGTYRRQCCRLRSRCGHHPGYARGRHAGERPSARRAAYDRSAPPAGSNSRLLAMCADWA